MSRLFPVLALCALVAGLGASGAAGQSAAAPSGADQQSTTPAALAAHPAAASPGTAANAQAQPRAVSSQTAARLTDGVPGYAPQKPAEPEPDDDQGEPSSADKPKNGIIRLPDYVVSERRPPVFTPKELLTKKALTQYIYKEHPGLNLWGLMPFSSLNAPIAKQISDEEARLNNISDMRDAAITTARGGDGADGEYIKKETQKTFMHDVWGSGDMDDGK